MTTLTLKLPKTLDEQLAAVAKRKRASKTAIVRQAVESYLTGQQPDQVNTQSVGQELTTEYFVQYLKEHGEPAPESFAAKARKYIGCLDSDIPTDLSTNKNHFEGFGE